MQKNCRISKNICFFELVKYKVVKKQLKDKPFKIAKNPGNQLFQ